MRFHGIEEETTIDGFCPIDNGIVSIDISYYSIPNKNFSEERVFNKHENKCSYLSNGKCNKNKDCPIFKEAPKSYTKKVSGKY